MLTSPLVLASVIALINMTFVTMKRVSVMTCMTSYRSVFSILIFSVINMGFNRC